MSKILVLGKVEKLMRKEIVVILKDGKEIKLEAKDINEHKIELESMLARTIKDFTIFHNSDRGYLAIRSDDIAMVSIGDITFDSEQLDDE